MAEETSKGTSPFYPGHPVPPEFFVGRDEQTERILKRGSAQVSAGKPVAIFVQGEYGIGKTSIAKLTMLISERDYGLHGIYATLGGCHTLDDISRSILEGTIHSGALNPRKSEVIRNWLAKYIGKQELFGISLNFDVLKKDAPGLSGPSNLLAFFEEVIHRLKDTDVKGIFLILDEINGMSGNPDFAHFIKGLIDSNAMRSSPVPLLLMLCGTEERRWEMIQKHQPVERIFDIVEICAMTDAEMEEFFKKAFDSVEISVDSDAVKFMSHWSAGFPKIMHLVGDAAYWKDDDGKIDIKDATGAVIIAAEDVGQKFVERQVIRALQSRDYLSILTKIAKMGPDVMSFEKAEVESGLTEAQKKKFNNFLQRMKKLKVLSSGATKGEYIFSSRMVRLYIRLKQAHEGANSKR